MKKLRQPNNRGFHGFFQRKKCENPQVQRAASLLPVTLGISVCLHVCFILFFSVKASSSAAIPALNEREETFSLVNIAEPPTAAPPAPTLPAAVKPSATPPVGAVPVVVDEPTELYIEAEENADYQAESEGGPKLAPVPVGNAGRIGTAEAPKVSGGGAAKNAEYVKRNYRYIQRLIRDRLVYPAPARKADIQGVVEVSFTIHEDGRVSAVTVLKGSGHGILDEAAVETIYAASPFPRPPAPARIAIPIAFRLR